MKKHKKDKSRGASLKGAAAVVGVNIPAAGELPINYREAGTLTLVETMGKLPGPGSHPRRPIPGITWKGFIEYMEDPNQLGTWVPARRTTAWMVAGFGLKRRPHSASYVSKSWPKTKVIDLFDIGAQHRSMIVLLRVVAAPGSYTLQLVEKDQKVLPAPVQQGELLNDPVYGSMANGFFAILKAFPVRGADGSYHYDNRYELRCTDATATLELYYFDEPPGFEAAQLEDGGPPPYPPSNQD
jgi:hypothetical protein